MSEGTTPEDRDVPLNGDSSSDQDETVEEYSTDLDWLQLAESNFKTARTYQDASLTQQWEKNADHFNNKHYRTSRYRSKAMRGRSRLFRPLTRASERKSSAQFAAAMFSNMDLVSVIAENQNDRDQVAAARIMKSVLQYRLTKTIQWYLTCMGSWQDTRVYGPCCTYTDWVSRDRESDVERPLKDVFDNDIEDRTEKSSETVIDFDGPIIEMIPVENLLLDPSCDWRDPIRTSPYVIRIVPMALTDVQARMEQEDSKTGASVWKYHTEGEILSAHRESYNTVRQSREGDGRTDKTDAQTETEYKVIWVHQNFVRRDGEEYVYWTLGTQYMLTEAKPLSEEFHHGRRPLTYGFSIIEAHRFSPSSPTELISGIQMGINDVANLRLDNIRLALNKRYLIRRGAMVDLESLMRSVPGGGVEVTDPEKDIKVIDTRDVTSSSYKEQERLETESNDIYGTFLGGSVQNNRSMNETVGGIEKLSEGADVVSEFDTRTFVESWVKPQLELLIQNIQAYETDEVIYATAFEDMNQELPKTLKYEMDSEGKTYNKSLIKRLLNDKMTIIVNVGLGATSPRQKIDTLNYTLDAVTKIPGQVERLDGDEISKEFFAAAGYQEGSRFLKSQEDKKEITEEDLKAAFEQGAQQSLDPSKMARVEMEERIGMLKLQQQEELGYAQIAAKEKITIAALQATIQVAAWKDKTARDTAASVKQSKDEELEFKRVTGKPGI